MMNDSGAIVGGFANEGAEGAEEPEKTTISQNLMKRVHSKVQIMEILGSS
jgi:hypothetical protein